MTKTSCKGRYEKLFEYIYDVTKQFVNPFPLQFNEQLKILFLCAKIQLSVDYLVNCHVDKGNLVVSRGYELLFFHSQRVNTKITQAFK